MQVGYKDIVENDYIFSKDGIKWIEINNKIFQLKKKYSNIMDKISSKEGFAFPSTDYVTRFRELTNKTPLIQIGNVNENEWRLSQTQKFEYLPNSYLDKKGTYLLNKPSILISLTGGSDTSNDISIYYDGSFNAFLNQRVASFSFKEQDYDLLYYFYALTKSSFFRQQWLGKGGIQKNTVAKERGNTFLPLIKDNNTIKFISLITQAILNKEARIKVLQKEIFHNIERELFTSQKSNSFSFELPRFKEAYEKTRLDTGLYSYRYKRFHSYLINYKHGYKSFFELNKKDVYFRKGPNLAVSVIGHSIYTSEQQNNFYTLLVSKYFTDYNTLNGCEYIGNKKELPTLEKGDILYSCRGEMGRLLILLEDMEKATTNFDCAIIKFPKQELYKTIFIGQFLNYLRDKKFVSTIAITGSGADSFTKYQFDYLLFPNFPESKQKVIANLYHNEKLDYNVTKCTVDNFLQIDTKFNNEAGIYDLDKSSKSLKSILNSTIDNIINDRKVKISFSD